MSSSDTAETYCALEKRRKLPEAVESNSASLVNVCDSQFSFGATRAWSRWTLSSRWGGRWSSSEKSWSWWSSCETWDNTITKLIFCQIWTYNSCLFVSFRSFCIYYVAFTCVSCGSEHREQTEGGSSWRPGLVSHGRSRTVSFGQSHSAALCRQHPCPLTCSGT